MFNLQQIAETKDPVLLLEPSHSPPFLPKCFFVCFLGNNLLKQTTQNLPHIYEAMTNNPCWAGLQTGQGMKR